MMYLEKCKAAAASIDPEQLAGLEYNDVLGSGGSFIFRGLGSISVLGSEEFVGLKLPKKIADDPKWRTISDIAQVSLLTTVAPDLLPMVPKFVCYLEFDGEDAGGQLTEDTTQAGTKSIGPMRASAKTRALLYEPFKAYGTMDEVLETETLDIATAFSVGDEERLLDFTPPPISGKVYFTGGEIRDYLRAADNALPEYTVTISPDTPLGDSLYSHYERLRSVQK